MYFKSRIFLEEILWKKININTTLAGSGSNKEQFGL